MEIGGGSGEVEGDEWGVGESVKTGGREAKKRLTLDGEVDR